MTHPSAHALDPTPVRIDKWLWAARVYKTRRLATEALQAGHVRLNSERCKPSKTLKNGDLLCIERNGLQLELQVLALSSIRGSAEIAHTLYVETPASIERRKDAVAVARMTNGGRVAPAQKPDKRERRLIRNFLARND